VSPVRYELCFYIPEDGILHSHRRENLKSYKEIVLTKYYGPEMLKIPRCPHNQVTDGGDVILTHRPHSNLQKPFFSASGTHLEAE
jgi:hypothetical protein